MLSKLLGTMNVFRLSFLLEDRPRIRMKMIREGDNNGHSEENDYNEEREENVL